VIASSFYDLSSKVRTRYISGISEVLAVEGLTKEEGCIMKTSYASFHAALAGPNQTPLLVFGKPSVED